MRRTHDHYPTADQLAAACLATIRATRARRVFDPGAGAGVWGRAARLFWPAAHITGMDIRAVEQPDSYDTWRINDAHTADLGGPYDLVIGNPPFAGAPALVRRLLAAVRPGGLVALLLRLSFLEPCDDKPASRRRDLLLQGSGLRSVTVTDRVSFTDGGTDNVTTAFFVWQIGYIGPASLGYALSDQPIALGSPDECAVCHTPIVQPPTGRRRKYCDACVAQLGHRTLAAFARKSGAENATTQLRKRGQL